MEKILVANWKMYKTRLEVRDYLAALELVKGVDIRIAPPFTLIEDMVAYRPRDSLMIGAQNMSERGHNRALTGEISSVMLKDAGAQFVILGHSERRSYFKESDELVAQKVERAIIDGIPPILCIGETLEEREAGHTERVLKRQLFAALESLTKNQLESLIISYEPVWAIGTGKSAEPEMVDELHHFLKEEVVSHFSTEKRVPILYGGSVNEKNIASFLKKSHIDGALIGGASLDVTKFNLMIQSVKDFTH